MNLITRVSSSCINMLYEGLINCLLIYLSSINWHNEGIHANNNMMLTPSRSFQRKTGHFL